MARTKKSIVKEWESKIEASKYQDCPIANIVVWGDNPADIDEFERTLKKLEQFAELDDYFAKNGRSKMVNFVIPVYGVPTLNNQDCAVVDHAGWYAVEYSHIDARHYMYTPYQYEKYMYLPTDHRANPLAIYAGSTPKAFALIFDNGTRPDDINDFVTMLSARMPKSNILVVHTDAKSGKEDA